MSIGGPGAATGSAVETGASSRGNASVAAEPPHCQRHRRQHQAAKELSSSAHEIGSQLSAHPRSRFARADAARLCRMPFAVKSVFTPQRFEFRFKARQTIADFEQQPAVRVASRREVAEA